MARLVHLNGPPGIGKSTLSVLYADRNPGTLNLDVDMLHRLVGGWQDEETDTWPVVWPLARAMAATHLNGGRDVVLPQYHARLGEITTLEQLAREHGADFREVVLLDDRESAIERFDRRARVDDDPWIRHHHRLVGLRGGPVLLGTMYDDLLEVVRLCPGRWWYRAWRGRWWRPTGSWRTPCASRPRDPVQRHRADAVGRGLRPRGPAVGTAPDRRRPGGHCRRRRFLRALLAEWLARVGRSS